MPILINPKTNTPLDVDEKDLSTALSEGLVFKPGSTVQLVDKNNNFLEAPAEEAAPLFTQGARLATPEDRAKLIQVEQEAEKKQLAAESPWLAAGMSALSAGTFGLSDVVGKLAGGDEYSSARKTLAEANPVADVLGGVGGSLAAMPVSIAGLGAKTAEAASKALAPTILAKAAAMPMIGKPLTTAAKAAMDAAAQGTIYGAGAGISEAALGNPEEVAENFLRGVGYGGLFGGIGGGGVSLAGQALGRTVGSVVSGSTKAAKAATTKAATLGMDAGEATAYKEIANSSDLSDLLSGKVAKDVKAAQQNAMLELKNIKKSLSDDILKTKDPEVAYQNAQTIQADIENTRKRLGELYADGLKNIDENLAPTGQSKELYDQMQAFGNKYEKIQIPQVKAAVEAAWENAIKSSIISGDLQRVSINSAKEEISLLFNLRREINDPDSDFYRMISGLNNGRAIIKEIRSDIGKQIQNATKNYGGNDAKYENIRSVFQMLDPMYGATANFQKEFNKAFGQTIMGQKNTITRSKIERFISDKGAAERKIFGKAYEDFLNNSTLSSETTDHIDELLNKYSEISKVKAEQTGRMKEIDDIMNGPGTKLDKLIRINDILGTGKGDKLRELLPQVEKIEKLKQLAGKDVQSAVVPTAIGVGLHTAGLPMGITYPVTGAVMAAVNPYQALRMINALDKVSKTAVKKGVELMDRATANLSRRPQAIMAREKGREPAKWEDEVKNFEQFQDPGMVQEYVQNATRGLESHPEIQLALQNQMTKGLMHLANTMPQSVVSPGDRLIPRKSEPAKADQVAWLRRKEVLANPEQFMTRIAEGEIPTKEEIETFNEVFPQYSTQLQAAVTKSLAETDKVIPVSKRLQIARLFGNSVDKQTDVDYNKKMQETLYKQEEPKPQKGGAIGSGNIEERVMKSQQTEMDRILSR